MDRQREWVSTKELREWLAIGRNKGYGILSREKITPHKIGKSHRIRRCDLERWLGDHRLTFEERGR